MGLKITRDGGADEGIKERKAISMLNSILWHQNVSKDSKRSIYNSVVENIIKYGSEVRLMKYLLEATENGFLEAGCWKIENGENWQMKEFDE